MLKISYPIIFYIVSPIGKHTEEQQAQLQKKKEEIMPDKEQESSKRTAESTPVEGQVLIYGP